MSVNSELLCSFELLKPLDSNALKNHIKKQKHNRKHILNSPVGHSPLALQAQTFMSLTRITACCIQPPERITSRVRSDEVMEVKA